MSDKGNIKERKCTLLLFSQFITVFRVKDGIYTATSTFLLKGACVLDLDGKGIIVLDSDFEITFAGNFSKTLNSIHFSSDSLSDKSRFLFVLNHWILKENDLKSVDSFELSNSDIYSEVYGNNGAFYYKVIEDIRSKEISAFLNERVVTD
jgi:hypothetical protein